MDNTLHKTHWIWVVFGIGILFRLYRLDSQCLWADEGLQFFISSGENISGVFDRLSRTFHPPISYVVHHLFLRIDETAFYLRLPSALFGIASLFYVYLFAGRIVSPKSSFCVLVVFAISPFHIWYSQEGRMYSQLLLLSLISSHALCLALDRNTIVWWGIYIISIIAGAFTHIFMGLTVISHLAWIIVYHRDKLLRLCTSLLLVLVVCLPLIFQWAPRLFTHAERSADAPGAIVDRPKKSFSWMAIPYTLYVYSAGLTLGPSVAELHANRSLRHLTRHAPSITIVSLVFGALFGSGLAILRIINRESFWLCVFGFAIPLSSVAFLSFLTGFPFNPRYAIVALPYFALAVGVAIAYLLQNNRRLGLVAICCVVAISATSLTNYYFNSAYSKDDVRSAIDKWRALSVDRPLLVSSPASGVKDAIRYYLSRAEEKKLKPVGKKHIVSDIKTTLNLYNTDTAYILFVRDWQRAAETEVADAYILDELQTNPAVSLYQIKMR